MAADTWTLSAQDVAIGSRVVLSECARQLVGARFRRSVDGGAMLAEERLEASRAEVSSSWEAVGWPVESVVRHWV